jgi:hypothetical protein
MRGIALALGFLALVAPAWATANQAVKPSLAETAARDFRTALPGYDVTIVDPLTLKLAPRGQEGYEVHLDRMAAFCTDNPQRCEDSLHGFTANMIEAVKSRDTPLDAATLRAVVRPARYVEQMKRAVAEKRPGVDLIAAPLAGDLYVLCYFDQPTTMRVTMTNDLAALALTPDTAMARCRRNVRAALPPLAPQLKDLPDRAFAVLEQKDYGSSYFLFPEDWAELAARLGGHLIVAVPDTGVILYGKEEDAQSVDALATLANEAAKKAERPISATVFRWTPSGWQPATK